MSADALEAVLRSKGLPLSAAIQEWYLLAGRWNQRGIPHWIAPELLAVDEGVITVLADVHGVESWVVRCEDQGLDDPPVFAAFETSEVAFPSFSQFVAAMIVNEVLVEAASEGTMVDIGHDAWARVRASLTPIVSSSCGEFLADAPLESATVVIFKYPGDGPTMCRSRTPEGQRWLERLRGAGAV
ncbi:hypothetical protein [uncultured Alsobacter sp.]|uniref:hypothetical protein n=1 Tax=uncultured Alsobacter sp. TaxID=1748258 RepID=UPI0025E299D1|nr:hypothetical protein [uncultured Alsobacter sp.]